MINLGRALSSFQNNTRFPKMSQKRAGIELKQNLWMNQRDAENCRANPIATVHTFQKPNHANIASDNWDEISNRAARHVHDKAQSRDLIEQKLLVPPISQTRERSSFGMPDFDQEPKDLLEKYQTQLDKLDPRIEILSAECVTVRNEIDEKSNKLASVIHNLQAIAEERIHVVNQLKVLEDRLQELEAASRINSPIVPVIEAEIKVLDGRGIMIKETLESLIIRRSKVCIITEAISSRLQSNSNSSLILD